MKKFLPPKSWFREEWPRLLARYDSLDIPKVLGHNDFHIKNMVYDPEKGWY